MTAPENRVPAGLRARTLLGGLVLALSLGACFGSPPPPVGPPLDAGLIGRQAQARSAIESPVRIVFAWSIQEPGMRLSGRGVARAEGPFRARLDLFASNGERIVAAALVDDDLRVPPAMADFVPPPNLFWAALGVFRPGPDAAAMGAIELDAERTLLRYQTVEGGEIEALLVNRVLDRLDRTTASGVREEVRLVREAGERFPREALYRNLRSTRELRLTLETVEYVEAFPSDIWNPGP
jgi:hypothetical protein